MPKEISTIPQVQRILEGIHERIYEEILTIPKIQGISKEIHEGIHEEVNMENKEITLRKVDTAYEVFLEMRELYLENEASEDEMLKAQDNYKKLSRIYWSKYDIIKGKKWKLKK